jgi:hypothetical protein
LAMLHLKSVKKNTKVKFAEKYHMTKIRNDVILINVTS